MFLQVWFSRSKFYGFLSNFLTYDYNEKKVDILEICHKAVLQPVLDACKYIND